MAAIAANDLFDEIKATTLVAEFEDDVRSLRGELHDRENAAEVLRFQVFFEVLPLVPAADPSHCVAVSSGFLQESGVAATALRAHRSEEPAQYLGGLLAASVVEAHADCAGDRLQKDSPTKKKTASESLPTA